MVGIALMVLRYIFLLLLLLFIFRLVKWMVGDLQFPREQQDAGLPARLRENKSSFLEMPTFSMTVLETSTPDLQPGDSFGVYSEMIIGRSEESDIIIRDSFASTRHARLYLKEEQYWLEDLKSTNGTFLNGVLVAKPTVLANADRIKIGGITFQFVRWGYEVGSNI